MDDASRERINQDIRQLELEYDPLSVGDKVCVTRYSGQTQFPTLEGFTSATAILNYGAHIGEREVYLYGTKRFPERGGKFKSAKMRDWHIDIGTLERLRKAFAERRNETKAKFKKNRS